MRLLLLKHFSFDDESSFMTWATGKKHAVQTISPPDGARFPEMSAFDLLVILGGPMSVYQEELHPWLADEKRFVGRAIEAGKGVLGICLGAQMLAEVLGAKVYRNAMKEIGWHPVVRTSATHPLLAGLPDRFYSFHWHGDTFELPQAAVGLAYSAACRNQAFAYGDRVLGLQFHLETSSSCMGTMLTRWSDELIDAPYIQTADRIVAEAERTTQSERMLHRILDNLEAIVLDIGKPNLYYFQ